MARETDKKRDGKRQQLVDRLRAQKKELQEARFRMTEKTRSETARHRTIRREIARTVTALNNLSAGGGSRGASAGGGKRRPSDAGGKAADTAKATAGTKPPSRV